MYFPFVIEKQGQMERQYDIWSRLLKDRIIFLGTDVNSDSANSIIAQLLFLQSDDPKKDIEFYINSPGGSVSDGLAIYDTMQILSCKVNTYCIGEAASMAAVLLAAGTGKRRALAHSRVMIHQPSGGTRGTAADIVIQAKEIEKMKAQLYSILAKHTKKDVKKIEEDSDRDFWMSPDEALEYGIIDEILTSERGKK